MYLTLLFQLFILDPTYLDQLPTLRTSICLLDLTVNCQFVERAVAPASAINANTCICCRTEASLTSTPNGVVSFKAQPLYPREKTKGPLEWENICLHGRFVEEANFLPLPDSTNWPSYCTNYVVPTQTYSCS